MMREEIEKVKELTGATEKQIKFHDDSYWSVAYSVNAVSKLLKSCALNIKSVLDYATHEDLPMRQNALESAEGQ